MKQKYLGPWKFSSWYEWEALKVLMQFEGRARRSKDDYAFAL